MALLTTNEYINQARFLLQDAEGVRYTDVAMYAAMIDGILEIKRMRPDIFFGIDVPDTIDVNTDISIVPVTVRVALLNYMCAYAETSDQEASDVGRATLFGGRFAAQLGTASVTP